MVQRLTQDRRDRAVRVPLKWRLLAPAITVVLLAAGVVAQTVKYTEIDLLSLSNVNYVEPNPAAVKAKSNKAAAFPQWLKALDGQPVTIRGYMLPYDVSASNVSEFMLTSTGMSCCFTPPTAVTDWVYVTMKGAGHTWATTDEIVVHGRFSVGEQFDEAGYVTSIFRIVADSIE